MMLKIGVVVRKITRWLIGAVTCGGLGFPDDSIERQQVEMPYDVTQFNWKGIIWGQP
jgi:hypothetical protein